MPEAYCNCCRKTTPHKVVMRRSSTEPNSGWQGLQYFLSMLVKGEHYYKMEKQMYCRVCNHQTSFAKSDFHGVETIKI